MTHLLQSEPKQRNLARHLIEALEQRQFLSVAPGIIVADPTHADVTFLQHAATADQLDVALGNLAVTNASSQSVKDAATATVTDRTALESSLSLAANDVGVTLSTTLPKASQSEVTRLSKMTGAKFDKTITEAMVAGDRSDIAAYNREAKSGTTVLSTYATSNVGVLKSNLTLWQGATASIRATTRATRTSGLTPTPITTTPVVSTIGSTPLTITPVTTEPGSAGIFGDTPTTTFNGSTGAVGSTFPGFDSFSATGVGALSPVSLSATLPVGFSTFGATGMAAGGSDVTLGNNAGVVASVPSAPGGIGTLSGSAVGGSGTNFPSAIGGIGTGTFPSAIGGINSSSGFFNTNSGVSSIGFNTGGVNGFASTSSVFI